MAQTQPFTPDDVYCVYCHAVAAGPCAVCGALCCPACVELVIGLTAPRAVCHVCRQHGRQPRGVRTRRVLAAAIALLLVIGFLVVASWSRWR